MAENPAQYAKLANEGLLLGYPVKISGQHARPDNGIHYHSTIKYFDPSKDHPHSVHELAQHLPLNPPDAKNTQIKFDKFKDRFGDDVHVVTLHGNSADKLKEHNGKFAHMGFPSKFEWTPHISVDKQTWDKLQSGGAKTAHEAGIEFGPAELKRGPKTLKTYHHEPDSAETKTPDLGDLTAKATAKSEDVLGMIPLMKPYRSEAQRRWAHTASGKEALGGEAGVHEWDEATKGKKLPEKVSKSDLLKPTKTFFIKSKKKYSPGQTFQHLDGKQVRVLRADHSSDAGKPHSYLVHHNEYKTEKSESEIHNLIKSESVLIKHAKALALTGETLSKYIEDNIDLKIALKCKQEK